MPRPTQPDGAPVATPQARADLFPAAASEHVPLAERLRPRSIDAVIGQSHLLGPGKPLRVAFESGRPHSMIFWGPPGVGKTTLLELIAGLREPTSGEIQAGPAHLVTQRPFLSAGTIRDALTLGRPATDAELWTALRHVSLDGFVAGLPDSLGTSLGDDGFGLSAGQRARLAIARALLSDAPVILLDEPTAHLDGMATTVVHDVIRELSTRHTVIAVTHRSDLVAFADQHVHMARESAEVTR